MCPILTAPEFNLRLLVRAKKNERSIRGRMAKMVFGDSVSSLNPLDGEAYV